MKTLKTLKHITLLVGMLLMSFVSEGQNSYFSSRNCNYYNSDDIGSSSWSTSWQSKSKTLTAGNYDRFDVYLTSGNTYYFSLCSADGGSSAFDSYMALYGSSYGCYSSSSTCLAYNDDGCGNASTITYTATESGWKSLFITGYSSSYSGSYTLRYKYEITYNMPTGSITTCSGTLYDSGGASGSYSSNEDRTLTIYPGTSGNKVCLTFTSFNSESGYDYLYIYDGTSTSATPIGTYSGTTSPGTVTATNSSGALTIRFTSDNSVTKTGWVATISCVVSITTPAVTTGNYSNLSTTSVTLGGTITDIGNASSVTAGICLSTTNPPTTGNSHQESSYTGTGSYTKSFTGLTTGTKYYFRAFAYNSANSLSSPSYGSSTYYIVTDNTISYTLNGGTVTSSNPTSYNPEFKSGDLPITLNNPTKSGYIFIGWTGSNGSTPQTTVTITTSTMGNLSYTANFIPVSSGGDCTEVQIGDGTSSSNIYGPLNNYWKYCYYQMIYHASNLSEGIITSISFDYQYDTPSTKKNNVVIYLGHTSKTEFSSGTDWVNISNFQQVYSGNLNCSYGWNTFELDVPFIYNGIDNLIMTIDDNSGEYDGIDYKFYYTTAELNTMLYVYSDGTNYDPTNPPSGTVNYYFPNTKFCIESTDPLPISLLSFTASQQPEYNLVQWTTATEKNNDLFILERSEDAVVFDEVYNVSGAGNSLEPLDYDFKDYNPVADITYYRLTQVDYDGSKTTSEIVSCIRTSEKMSNWEYFKQTYEGLQVNSSDNPIEIRCHDVLGRLIYTYLLPSHSNTTISLNPPFFITVYENGVPKATEKVFR